MMMNKIINLSNLLFLMLLIFCGCTENIHFLKGTYWYSDGFQTERLTFEDSVNFDYFDASDDVASSCGQNGKYLIYDNILQLNFNIRQYEKPFIYNTIDSTNSVSDSINLEVNIIDTYTKKFISLSMVTIYNSLNEIVSIDTCDNSGHIFKRLKKSSGEYLLKTSFNRIAGNEYYYPSSIKLQANLNYKINFNTIKRYSTNYYDGKTLEFKIVNMSKTSFEVQNKTPDKKRKKFILGKPFK